MIQAVVPYMRKQGFGKVINIGSISGRFTRILSGGYCASKHAVEAINGALRLELYEFGVQSTVIEAGPMRTNFYNKLAETSKELMENSASPYRKFYLNDKSFREKQKLMDSIKAANRICEIIKKKKIKPRYKVAVPLMLKILMLLPNKLKEFILLRH